MSSPQKIRRLRMADVAREAGVSLATVDRVLNGRGFVHDRTRSDVLQIAGRLGYIPKPEPVPRARQLRFDIVFAGGTNAFLQLLADEIGRAAAARADELAVTVHRVEGFKPEPLAAKLNEIESSDGVGVVALDHPAVREAIRGLRARGIPVATLVSDMSSIGSIGYVGIDNRASGRLAGQMLGRLVGERAGSVILFLGSRSYRGHEERENGFRRVLEDEFPRLSIVDVQDTRDDIAKARRETLAILRRRSDVLGIYNIAAGNRGIAEALAEARPPRRIVFVAHELTEHSRNFLISGLLDVVIDQNPRLEAQEILRLLATHARGLPVVPPEQIRITPIFRENMP
jgi:LacI family transcriptional regulator